MYVYKNSNNNNHSFILQGCRTEIIRLNISILIIRTRRRILHISSPWHKSKKLQFWRSPHTQAIPSSSSGLHGDSRLPCERDQGKLMNLHDRLWRVCVCRVQRVWRIRVFLQKILPFQVSWMSKPWSHDYEAFEMQNKE